MTNFSSLYQKTLSLALAMLICALNANEIAVTNAYYSDYEVTAENSFTAAILDFTLSAPVTSYTGLTPNNATTPFAVVVATTTNSLPFDYFVSIEDITGDVSFCEALQLKISHEAQTVAEAPLASIVVTGSSSYPLGGTDWSFTASLGTAPSTLSGQSCTFTVLFDGWQVGYESGEAYHDTETVTFTVTAGTWQDTPEESDTVVDIAAVRDSSVDESKPDTNSPATNGGGSQQLELRRASGNDSEAFIGFDYKLPAGSVVTAAELKAYLYQAPTPNTTYTALRVDGPWTETGVTWNTKPTAVVSDTTSTGDGNAKWLSWDVTSDVAGVVAGSYSNYGWNLRDTDPHPVSGSRTGKFRSSEHESQSDVRPVLEVTFEAPVATTNHLVINEVFFDVDSTNGSDANNEWIELYNPTANPISIENWDICDNTSCDNITVATSVPAFGFAVITNNTSTFDLHWTDIPDAAVKVALGASLGNGLAAAGDRVVLKDASDVVIDQVSYGTDTTVFNPSVAITGEDGKSIARVVKGFDADSRDDWILNATPNPGTNPGSDNLEIMRFTEAGVEVASAEVGLSDLPELTETEIETLILAEAMAEIEMVLAEEIATIGDGGSDGATTEPVYEAESVATTSESIAEEVPILVPVIEETDSTPMVGELPVEELLPPAPEVPTVPVDEVVIPKEETEPVEVLSDANPEII